MGSTPKNEMPTKFWEWFDSKQKAEYLSDRQIATRAGITNSVISKARNGIQPIGFEALTKIALAFNTSPVSLFFLAGLLPESESASPSAVEFADLFERMSEDDQEEILALVRMKARRRKAKEKTEG